MSPHAVHRSDAVCTQACMITINLYQNQTIMVITRQPQSTKFWATHILTRFSAWGVDYPIDHDFRSTGNLCQNIWLWLELLFHTVPCSYSFTWLQQWLFLFVDLNSFYYNETQHTMTQSRAVYYNYVAFMEYCRAQPELNLWCAYWSWLHSIKAVTSASIAGHSMQSTCGLDLTSTLKPKQLLWTARHASTVLYSA